MYMYVESFLIRVYIYIYIYTHARDMQIYVIIHIYIYTHIQIYAIGVHSVAHRRYGFWTVGDSQSDGKLQMHGRQGCQVTQNVCSPLHVGAEVVCSAADHCTKCPSTQI